MELKKNNIPTDISDRITVLRYPLSVLVIMLHASWGRTNSEFIKFDLSHNPFVFVQWFIQAIGCGAVPLFFAISSYLLFKKADSYSVLLKKKLHSLVIPYLVWTSLTILFYWGAAKFSFMKGYFESKPDLYVSGWNLLDWIKAFVGWGTESGHPIGGPLWFVRDLIFFILLVPIIRFFMNKFSIAFLLLITIMYFYGFGLYFIGTDSIFYCILGAYFAQVDEKYDIYLFIPFIVSTCLSVISFFIMKSSTRGIEIFTCLMMLMLWSFSHYLVRNEKIRSLLKKLAPYSFFLFAVHGTLMLIAKTLLCRMFTLAGVNFLIVWALCIILVAGGGTALAVFVRNFMPKTWFILNGGR